jgi:hypothetical protein
LSWKGIVPARHLISETESCSRRERSTNRPGSGLLLIATVPYTSESRVFSVAAAKIWSLFYSPFNCLALQGIKLLPRREQHDDKATTGFSAARATLQHELHVKASLGPKLSATICR